MRDPASPKQGFSRFRPVMRRDAVARAGSTLPAWPVPPSSTSIARCSPARPVPSTPTPCATRASPPAASRASGCCTACSTSSARRCRRCCSPARPPPWPRDARGRRCVPPGRRRRGRWRRRCSRSPGSASPSTAPPGVPLVMATTTPYELVKPLGRLARLRRRASPPVTASTPTTPSTARSSARSCGRPGKRSGRARRGRRPHDVDLAESYAYSDSVFDTPLLSAVGHPVVVNPDPSMVVMATAAPLADRQPRRVTGRRQDPGARRRAAEGGAAVRSHRADALRPLRHLRGSSTSRPRARRSSSATIAATSTPARWRSSSPAAVAPCASSARRRCSTCRSSASSSRAMGGIRVDRASGSNEPLQAAVSAIEGGELVAIMPQGTIPRGPAFFDPVLKGRWGAARLAQLTKAPGDPGRPVGHRAGVAAVEPPAQRAQRRRPAAGHGLGRTAGGVEAPLARCRHQADHGGDLGAAARRGAPPAPRRPPPSWPPPTRTATAASPTAEHDRRPGTD